MPLSAPDDSMYQPFEDGVAGSPGRAGGSPRGFTLEESPRTRLQRSSSLRELALDATGRSDASPSVFVRPFAENFAGFVRFSRVALCLPQPGAEGGASSAQGRLRCLWLLFGLHVLCCCASFGGSFFEVGFGTAGRSEVKENENIMLILTSFDFISLVAAFITGILCAVWFFATRQMMLETFKEEDGGPERTVDMRRRRLAADYPSVGFGWDFFLAYPGVEEQDAAHAAADLFATLEDRCKEASGSHYPAGVFLDQKKHREQLALLYGKSQAASGPQCPPGPKTGFHIFLSYRRTNASDARALKQALEKFGYLLRQIFLLSLPPFRSRDICPGAGTRSSGTRTPRRHVCLQSSAGIHCIARPAARSCRLNVDAARAPGCRAHCPVHWAVLCRWPCAQRQWRSFSSQPRPAQTPSGSAPAHPGRPRRSRRLRFRLRLRLRLQLFALRLRLRLRKGRRAGAWAPPARTSRTNSRTCPRKRAARPSRRSGR